MEELGRELEKARNERRLVIDNPHTVWTVSSVLDLDLTREQREKAGLLAYKVFKRIYTDKEPACCDLFGVTVNRYATEDLWILKTSVKRVFQGAECPAPAAELIPYEVWMQCCAEVCLFVIVDYTDNHNIECRRTSNERLES